MNPDKGEAWWTIHDRIMERGAVTTIELHEWYGGQAKVDTRVQRSEIIHSVIRQMLTDGDAHVMVTGTYGRKLFHTRPCRYGR